ncbi:MAG: hypothetical protein WKF71_15160 [Pyrinomonadaceae bacterium]
MKIQIQSTPKKEEIKQSEIDRQKAALLENSRTAFAEHRQPTL